jgi:hypothetical protein
MARVRRWPIEAEDERQDAIAYFEELEKLARQIDTLAKRDPVQVQILALRMVIAAQGGRHTLQMARPTKKADQ